MIKTDVAIVGGGPGGTAAAMFLLQQGIKPLIIEKLPFPRYHIGESLTGVGGSVLRELGFEKEMQERRHPVKFGVQVFGRSKRGTWYIPVAGRGPDGKLFDWETWQVRRSEFDHMMQEEAVKRGADLLIGQALRSIQSKDGTVKGLTIKMPDGRIQEIQSEVVMDCSGQATWLANQGITGTKYLGAYDRQIAIFSQVAGALRDDGSTRKNGKDNTLIFYEKKYHWAWFIPLDDEIVSVGVVVPSGYFLEKNETKMEFLKRELRELHPELSRRIPEIQLVEDVHVIPNYSYQVREFCGKGFVCIGDAHRFVDPIFSFGLTVSLVEAQHVAPIIREYLSGKNRDLSNPFSDHQLYCEKGSDIFEDLVDCFWENPGAFALFVYLRHPEHILDMFAGRVYGDQCQASPALLDFRKVLARQGLREASYRNGNDYSVPIGSRFHPERASIWKPNFRVESTEDWMGPR